MIESIILKLEINEHEPESVLENEDYTTLWDFSIQIDVIEVRRPDLFVVDKNERSCKIIDFAVT